MKGYLKELKKLWNKIKKGTTVFVASTLVATLTNKVANASALTITPTVLTSLNLTTLVSAGLMTCSSVVVLTQLFINSLSPGLKNKLGVGNEEVSE